jgi:hypothetical protein
MDWAEACRILGVPETSSDVEIKEQYLYKAQLLHPDKNQDKPENLRKRAEAELVLVNQAYALASNPANNPYKVPPRLSVDPTGIRFKEVHLGEQKTTTLRIVSVGGPYTSIWIDNHPSAWLTVTSVNSLTAERLPLEVTLEATGTGVPGTLYSCDLLIKLENENTHLIDRVQIKVEMHVESGPAAFVSGKTTPAPRQSAPISSVKPVTPARKDKLGFSPATFVTNLLAFALLEAVVMFLVFYFTSLNQIIFNLICIILFSVAVGFSLNHALDVGSRHPGTQPAPKSKSGSQKP